MLLAFWYPHKGDIKMPFICKQCLLLLRSGFNLTQEPEGLKINNPLAQVICSFGTLVKISNCKNSISKAPQVTS